MAQNPENKSSAPADQQSLLDIFNAALAAADPYDAVLKAASLERDQLQIDGANYDLAAFERIIVVGAGKATARMASGGRIAARRQDLGRIDRRQGRTHRAAADHRAGGGRASGSERGRDHGHTAHPADGCATPMKRRW